MRCERVAIDGSMGEGGGQVLRSSLTLALVTGRSLNVENIRAGRKKPGLLRQHLSAVRAAAEVGQAEVRGGELGSQKIEFVPGAVVPGEYRFSIGSAGSATLVLQTVLPALLTASGPSKIVLEGGTHNPMAPPFEFLEKSFLPCVRRMGPRVEATLDRPGFYPAGGGAFAVAIEPVERLESFDLLERGKTTKKIARARVANLPLDIGARELEKVRELLTWDRRELCVEEFTDAAGSGNVLILELHGEHVTQVVTGFGERRASAHSVAERAVRELRRYLTSDIPVDEHLADQLLLPLALAKRGTFRTVRPSSHTRTNIDVIRSFLDIDVKLTEKAHDEFIIELQTNETAKHVKE